MTFEEWFKSTVYTDEDCARDAWQSAYVQTSADMVPKGYVLVPVEPTQKMLDIMHDLHIFGEMEENIYKAIIQAAQE